MSIKKDLLTALTSILDPKTKKNIVEAGYISIGDLSEDATSLTLNLNLPPEVAPYQSQLEALVKDTISSQFKELTVKFQTQFINQATTPRLNGLDNIKNIIAVSSCKGGVGKSTVSVNLAYTLSKQGYKVGIFDADVYGPSLPTMVSVPNNELTQVDDLLVPFEFENVKLMSFGFVQDEDNQGPAILRGPMVTQVINQLLSGTLWGELDYLVLDLPPGTGDVQLTLGQMIPVTAAVIVTTPQHISFIDVVKGIEMFDKLKVPTVAVVENMSYFTCGSCDEKHMLFGKGAKDRLVNEFGFKHAITLPILEKVATAGDNGTPYVLQAPDTDIKKEFDELANGLISEVKSINDSKGSQPLMGYTKADGILLKDQVTEKEIKIDPYHLRTACKCARCVNEMTGEPIPQEIPKDVEPLSINPVGNYAFGINWSDGHSSIFPITKFLQVDKVTK